MTMTTILPLNEVKAKLSEMVGRARDHHEDIVISVHGEPAAVLMSMYEYESLKETLEILSDAEVMQDIAQAHSEPMVSLEQVEADLAARRAAERPAAAA